MKKILIADDDVDIIKLVSLYLESDNYELFCAYDGYEAKEILEKKRYRPCYNRYYDAKDKRI